MDDEEHPLHRYSPQVMCVSNKFRLPICRTMMRSNSFFVYMSKLCNDGFSL